MKIISFIEEPPVIRKILVHLDLSPTTLLVNLFIDFKYRPAIICLKPLKKEAGHDATHSERRTPLFGTKI
jgi:hypothetical protein